ncbi:MAG TPA: TGS domain-containing protein, partial [Ktedonobacterales bacterium]|nr:TGS domain-containing protein [Ktedonobacterales bacterium]
GRYGAATVDLIQRIERFDALQRPAAARRRLVVSAERGEVERTAANRARRRERQHKEDAEAMRVMFVGMAEDLRVVIFRIADQLCTMRAVRDAADLLRLRAGAATSHSDAVPDQPGAETAIEERVAVDARHETPSAIPPASDRSLLPAPRWTLDECIAAAEETRTLYAPLASRLGMSRLESELEDLAFAVLEPDDYRWLTETVASEKFARGSYVRRICDILRDEMAKIGVKAQVSGRVKHLYSIFKKVQARGIRDVTQLYDIVAFRVIVETVADCYLVLGHVHQLWRPKDGRIKDLIANPKSNGYQSLHTTVFCLDDRLAEFQIRTREMHQLAEFGVAMHWHYKTVGDRASSSAPELRVWVKQVEEWQPEIHQTAATPAEHSNALGGADMPNELIYVFTPAGDPKELSAGSTPLDFAYRIHSDVGDHCAGARVTTEDERLVTKMVPLDYQLKTGDTVEIITHKHAHPTRDWLRFAVTKPARTHIQRYLKAHERHIDQQIGRDRLDRDLKLQGLRSGIDDLREDDLLWTAHDLDLPDVESLLVALGSEKLRTAVVIGKLRERLPDRFAPGPESRDAQSAAGELNRPSEAQPAGGVDVAGVPGVYTRLASCCNPVPGDAVRGFITRGRGVVVHQANCPNLAAMLAREPERAVAVELAQLDGQHAYRVPIIIQASDRAGLLADVTGVISRLKINMVKVATVTNPARHTATVTAVLELTRADQLDVVLRQILGVKSIVSAERKQNRSTVSGASEPESSRKRPSRGRR